MLIVVERVIEKIIREWIVSHEMQFGIMLGRGTSDAIFIVRQLQEKNKVLRVNMGKTKVMICGNVLDTIKLSGNYPCNVCRRGVGINSIFCTSCNAWVYKKCNGIKDKRVDIPDFKCNRCLGLVHSVDGRPIELVSLGDQKLEVAGSFVYLGDGISTIARVRSN